MRNGERPGSDHEWCQGAPVRSAVLGRDLKNIAHVVFSPQIFKGGSKQVAGWVKGEACERGEAIPASGEVVQHLQLESGIHCERCPKSVGTTTLSGAVDVSSLVKNQA